MRGWIAGAAVAAAPWLAAASATAADQYAIDGAHTTVGFNVAHMVVSRVHGTFNDVAGTVTYDPADLTRSSVAVTIKAASIDTRHDGRDEHLRSADFLDAAQFPELTFQSTRIEHNGDALVAVGNLTIHGVTKDVRLPFRLTGPIQDPMGKTRLGVEAEVTLSRRDFGIVWSKVMDGGGLVVGDDVRVIISAEAIR
jgi:polyisoprenoid-binding protein YceI